jgi:hypothetical protein
MTLEEAQRARAEGLRRWLANPENSARRAEKIRAAQKKLWTEERKAWMSKVISEMIANGEIKRGHTPKSRKLIGEVVRARYEKAKAEWLDSNGAAELAGNIRWARIDWDFARELRDCGATIDDIAAFFKSQRSVITRGLKNGK